MGHNRVTVNKHAIVNRTIIKKRNVIHTGIFSGLMQSQRAMFAAAS